MAAATTITLTQEVARRYLLGRQGLWPGRRWIGKAGAAQALRALEAVQVDPMTVVARGHDLALWSRVTDYAPEHLDQLLYRDRAFFDYGGHLDIYPMEELPYWRLHMRRRRDEKRQAEFVAANGALLDEVRATVRAHGPLGNRDLAGNAWVTSYRGRKDTSLALYYLWLTGELMTHSRRSFERLYDLRERVAPAEFEREASEPEAERHFAIKTLRQVRPGTLSEWAGSFAYQVQRRVERAEARARLAELVADGEAITVQIEGLQEARYIPAADAPLLTTLSAGSVPTEWRVTGSTTLTEVNFLSPTDNLLVRKRTALLFDFEYLWEVYKPVERRRWGYYTMPVLYGDRLVGRIDPKLDRKAGVLAINGFWLEDEGRARDPAFAEALARGLSRFADFHGARRIELDALRDENLRDRLQAAALSDL